MPFPTQDDKPEEIPENRHRKFAAVALEPTGFNNAVNMIGKEGWPAEEDVIFDEKKKYMKTAIYEIIQQW